MHFYTLFGIFLPLLSLRDGHLIVCKCVQWDVSTCRKGNRLWTSQNKVDRVMRRRIYLHNKPCLEQEFGPDDFQISSPTWITLDWYIMIIYFILQWERGLLVLSKLHHRFLTWITEKEVCGITLPVWSYLPVPSPFPSKTVGNKTPEWYIAVSFGKHRWQGREFAVCELPWGSSTRCQQIHRKEQCYLNLRKD